MKKIFLNVLAVGLFLIGLVGYANADLVEEDLFTLGDGLVTYDTDTGLYWLDLTVTTNLSYNDVLNEISEGGSLEGFWYATTADIDTLQVSAGLPAGLFFSSFPIYLDNMNQLLDLVGLTDPSTVLSAGITSDPFEPTTTIDDRIVRYFSARNAAQAAQGVIGDNIASSTTGNWLITDTLPDLSEPDLDNDGIPDDIDNCIDTPNPGQVDSDVDGVGDLCDVCIDIPDDQTDSDGDGLGDACDECPTDPDKILTGVCGCGTPDTDSDSDGTADCIDACPFDSLNDVDNDTICGDVDNCPDTANTDQLDLDSDGFGDVCDPDADNDGFSGDDCNDLDANINPAATEIPYNGIDENCNGMSDDDDLDSDGYIAAAECNDNDALINPGATEIPYNGIDENCNGMSDDDDLDSDGYIAAAECDDNDALINPGATEIPYNGIDENCNGMSDDDDLDNDGYIAAAECDDNDALINPGATEIPYNGIDENCNGMSDDDDLDSDGYIAAAECNDNDPLINPGATEIPYNGIDENCNGMSDDDDLDSDGYIAAAECDDNDPLINPGVTEVKHDGIDQDCNGYDLTIDITKANYNSKRDKLSVQATSDLGAAAMLEVVGYGPMTWKSNKQKWVLNIRPAGGDPGSTTVIGIEGQETVPTY